MRKIHQSHLGPHLPALISYPILSYSFAYSISKKEEKCYQVHPPMGINSFEHLVNADKSRALRKLRKGICWLELYVYIQMEEKGV